MRAPAGLVCRRSSVQVVAHLGNVQKAAGAALASVLVAGVSQCVLVQRGDAAAAAIAH